MHGSVLGLFAYGGLQPREITGRDVLEVGSLDVNGSVRPIVETNRPSRYIGIDVVDGPGVDVVADALDLVTLFGADSFDVVISTEMLEHAEDWAGSVLAMVRVLRAGGVLVITTRSTGFAWHHPPDRWRFTQQSFAEFMGWLGLDLVLLCDDPECPGVFVKARKPTGWAEPTEPMPTVAGVTPMVPPLKLLGLPMQPDGTGYYRFWQPWGELVRSSGHIACVPPVGYHQWIPDEDEVAAFDVVSRQRPSGRLGLREWRRWKALGGGPALIYETDDNILAPDTTLPHLLDAELRESIRTCLELADMVTCSTEPLAEVLREHNPDVTVVPNFIHADALDITRPHRERLTLGWAGGITHLPDLMLLQDPIDQLATSWGQDFDLHFVGVDYSSIFASARTRFTPWQTDIWDYYHTIDADIGLIPLVDTDFNRCRTPIKALEYAALGIPVVASDVEAYRGFVIDGVTGFLVRTEAEWINRIHLLADDPALRDAMGAKARELARAHTIQANWPRWAHALEHAATIAGKGQS